MMAKEARGMGGWTGRRLKREREQGLARPFLFFLCRWCRGGCTGRQAVSEGVREVSVLSSLPRVWPPPRCKAQSEQVDRYGLDRNMNTLCSLILGGRVSERGSSAGPCWAVLGCSSSALRLCSGRRASTIFPRRAERESSSSGLKKKEATAFKNSLVVALHKKRRRCLKFKPGKNHPLGSWPGNNISARDRYFQALFSALFPFSSSHARRGKHGMHASDPSTPPPYPLIPPVLHLYPTTDP